MWSAGLVNQLHPGHSDLQKTTSWYSEGNEYEVKVICDSAVYTKESKEDQWLSLYYLILLKDYLEEKNTWESTLTIQHFWKLVIIFHKEYQKKPITTWPLINDAPPMTKPTVKLTIKNQGQPAKAISANKLVKRNQDFEFTLFLTLFQ